jgi:hypothetical protein
MTTHSPVGRFLASATFAVMLEGASGWAGSAARLSASDRPNSCCALDAELAGAAVAAVGSATEAGADAGPPNAAS